MSLLLKDQYDSLSRAEDIDSDVLILLADQDNIIPGKHSRRLIEALSDELSERQVSVKTIPDSGHNDLSNHQQYYASIRKFLGY